MQKLCVNAKVVCSDHSKNKTKKNLNIIKEFTSC